MKAGVARKPKRGIGGKDIGLRQGAEKIGCHILLTSLIIAYQISTYQ
jgi:hypothetical protein